MRVADSYLHTLKANLSESIRIKENFLRNTEALASFEKAATWIVGAYQKGGRLYIAGNGGSAADAQHLAAELVSKLARARNPLPAEALTVDTSVLTAIGNDYGFDQIFARQIAGKMQPNDIFLGITTSGNSPNIIHAIQQCRKLGVLCIILTGRNGGEARTLADLCIIADGDTTSSIQELHMVLYHSLCECIETAICFSNQAIESRAVSQ